MHRLYLDTNILVDFLARRQPFLVDAASLVKYIEQRKAEAFTSAINVVHAHYQLRKLADESTVRALLEKLLLVVSIVDIPAGIAGTALQNQDCRDFEDAVQWAICQHHRIDFMITRNQTDFPAASQPVVCDAEMYLKTYQTQA